MTDIVWQDPPSEPKGAWEEIARALKANPGRWALVRTGISYAAGSKECRKYGLERRALKNSDGRIDIYARAVEQ